MSETPAPTLPKLTLFSYWRSSSAWRVRIALAMKGISYEYVPVPLLQKKQCTEDFKAFNPMQQVPSLKIETTDGKTYYINQSLAIIDYIETLVPENPIWSKDPLEKAYEQELALDIVSGIQPVQNLKVLLHVKQLAGGDDEKKMEWGKKYITEGLVALEAKLKHRPLANDNKNISAFHTALIPQLYNARRFFCDMDAFPTLLAIEAYCKELPFFASAEPDSQPDAGHL